MATVQTQSTSDDEQNGSTDTDESTLLQGLKNDEKQDTRKCPHTHCHGNLSVVEQDNGEIVLCQSCRCTPDGVYYEPEERSTPSTSHDGQCSQYLFFKGEEPDVTAFDPRGNEWDNGLQFRNSGEREEYRNSGNVKMVGGFEDPWSQEHTTREDSII